MANDTTLETHVDFLEWYDNVFSRLDDTDKYTIGPGIYLVDSIITKEYHKTWTANSQN